MSATVATATTLAAALSGAALAALAGVPAGALIGGALAVAAVAAAGVAVGLPTILRDFAFAAIGVSLGSGIDARLLDHVATWSVSLAILVASLAATVLVGRLTLSRLFGFDAATATLASAPGTMSNAVAIAAEGRGDATAVMFLQLVRLLVLVAAVPPLAVLLDAPDGLPLLPTTEMGPAPLLCLVAAASGLGLLGARVGLPAASLLAGMVLSAAGHAAGVVGGMAPPWAIFAAFAVTGAALGARLSRVSRAQTRRYLVAGLSVVGVTLVVSLAFAALTRALTGLPFGQVWIAYAPGGVEAMAAIGLALGYDPAYVAVHHFTRIFALVLLVPAALRL